MHLGLRRRNLSQLLICPQHQSPKSDTYLKKTRRGEMRWVRSGQSWEVYVPSLAFKNWNSRFFRNAPFRLSLSDTAGLYSWIRKYLMKYRPLLLNGRSDPGTFFVRTMSQDLLSAEFA